MPGLGQHHHPISTCNPLTQQFFDQGLALVFAFNEEEAVLSFQRAAELDPQSAMPIWGIALALGPNINEDMDGGRERMAYEHVQRALLLRGGTSNEERRYIEALAKRYSPDPRADLGALARDYSNAMRDLSKRYPKDLDAATLYAESLMDLHPWRLWRPDGSPGEDTREIVRVLESILRRDPTHLGANHYYIHAVEGSPNPERAFKSAFLLEKLAPAAGHIVHMPSHIYMRTGDYSAAARSNEAAAAADRAYLSRASKWGSSYDLMYYGHNLQSLVAAYAMAGRFADADRTANDLVTHADALLLRMPEAEFYLPTELFVLLRFGRWDRVLITQRPEANLAMTVAFWHFARGVAAARKGFIEAAEKERQSLQESRESTPADIDFGGYSNKARKFLDLAIDVLDARIAWANGDHGRAIDQWYNATEIEDSLNYSEPPDWYYPVRESLGAALLLDNQSVAAERVFRTDLERNRRNPRSLFGLWQSLVAQRKVRAARKVRQEFAVAWGHADVQLTLADL
jgi:tetratricopeptide (TPR) repeat protein